MTLLNKKGEILNISSSNALLEFLLEGTPGQFYDGVLKHPLVSFIQQ